MAPSSVFGSQAFVWGHSALSWWRRAHISIAYLGCFRKTQGISLRSVESFSIIDRILSSPSDTASARHGHASKAPTDYLLLIHVSALYLSLSLSLLIFLSLSLSSSLSLSLSISLERDRQRLSIIIVFSLSRLACLTQVFSLFQNQVLHSGCSFRIIWDRSNSIPI